MPFFLQEKFHVKDLSAKETMASAVYLQVSIISQALIFVTCSHGLSWNNLGFCSLQPLFLLRWYRILTPFCSSKWI